MLQLFYAFYVQVFTCWSSFPDVKVSPSFSARLKVPFSVRKNVMGRPTDEVADVEFNFFLRFVVSWEFEICGFFVGTGEGKDWHGIFFIIFKKLPDAYFSSFLTVPVRKEKIFIDSSSWRSLLLIFIPPGLQACQLFT